MKRHHLIPAIIAILLVTLACGNFPRLANGSQPTAIPSATQVPPNPCANVLLPFEPGNGWIYRVEREAEQDKQIGLTVSLVEGSQATLDMLDTSSGVVVRTIVECDDGAIMNYPTLSLGMLFSDDMQGDLIITYLSGVYMPAEEQFLASNWDLAWDGEYRANGTLSMAYEGESMAITLDNSPLRMAWKVEGREPVNVPAGTFDQAYKLIHRTELDTMVDMAGFPIQATMIIETEEWYGAGLGLLKTRVAAASFSFAGITFPIDMKGEVELVEFRSDP